jgi:uncharacterized protein YbaR (Trm112 family)
MATVVHPGDGGPPGRARRGCLEEFPDATKSVKVHDHTDPWMSRCLAVEHLLPVLRCPRDVGTLERVSEDELAYGAGHKYPIIREIPVFLVPEDDPTRYAADTVALLGGLGTIPAGLRGRHSLTVPRRLIGPLLVRLGDPAGERTPSTPHCCLGTAGLACSRPAEDLHEKE